MRFGFEIKGPVAGLKTEYPYGIHLPNNISSQWQDPRYRKKLEKEIENVSRLSPIYAVLHGASASKIKNGIFEESPSPMEKEFIADIGAAEYLKTVKKQISLIKRLKGFGIPVVLEVVPPISYGIENNVYLPEIFLNIRLGLMAKDLLKIGKDGGCGLLVDIEHLLFSQNFAQRKHAYAGIPAEIPESLSEEEKFVMDNYGIFIRKGSPPVLTSQDRTEREIKKIGAKFYHLCGTSDGKRYLEIKNGKVCSHSPITMKDKGFRKYLNMVLKQKPEILILEVAGPGDNPCWTDRPENSQKISFENICKILYEEL